MNSEEIKSFLESNKDSDEVKSLIGGFFTPDRVTNFLNSHDEGKKILSSHNDVHFKKSLESWQKENMPKLIEDEITKRYPAETEDQKALKKLAAEFENEKKIRVRAELKNKAISHLTTKNIPLDLADYFLGEDENSTNENLKKLESVWENSLKAAVEGKFKEGGRDPQKGNEDHAKGDLGKLSIDEYIKARKGK